MVRRRATPVERHSVFAIWSRRLSLFAIPVVLIAILLFRIGAVETIVALGVFLAGLAVAALGVLVALGAFIGIWNDGYRGVGRAFAGLFIGLFVLSAPIGFSVMALRLPFIHDVTTDTADPPRIVAGAAARSAGANPAAYPGPETAKLQQQGYPDVRPLEKEWTPEQAYANALEVVTKRRWRILDQVTPRAGRDGRIEAVARSLVFGFRDDVVIRVRATAIGARVDIRSASRFGRHDFGANARRVRSLRAEIDDLPIRRR
jgi:uncharacterized protein (DUF1499 family)